MSEKNQIQMKRKKAGNQGPLFWGGVVLLFLAGIFFSFFLYCNHYYPSGCDIWGHLYKSNYMYQSIKDGIWYPLYTKDWYNGLAPFRYWAPFPYYCMALLQAVAGGNVFIGYCLFAGVSIVLGGIPWLLLGKKLNRPVMGTMVGLVWFFMPENYRVFFSEGNLPRMVTAILIPYLILFIYNYLENEKRRSLVGIVICMSAMTLSHTMISAMTGIAAFLYFCFYSIENHSVKKPLRILVCMIFSYVMVGIWLVPALSGGLVGMDSGSSSAVMASLMYELTDSLNPTNRVWGITDTFYYGISVLVISILGILLGKKKNRAGYNLAILILLLTTSAALPILSKLPLSQLLWMMRFATIAYGFFLLSFLEWTTLKKGFGVVFFAILFLDTIPFANVNRYFTDGSANTKKEVSVQKEITNQRGSILDLSAFGSYPSFAFSKEPNPTMYTYGWAWQGAETAPNIVKINTALEKEKYTYVFDRSVELGDDTVFLRKDLVGKNGKNAKDLMEEAEKSGYELYQESQIGYIFKKSTPATFGVKTKYKGLAIGNYGSLVELYYPSFTSGDSSYVDEYSYEELAQFSTIYLSGFQYHNREKAEDMINRLSENGVKVVIDMCHIPVDKKTNRMHFMGVYMQDITFEKRFPEMRYDGDKFATLDFDSEDTVWNTGYIEGVDNATGTLKYSGKLLPYLGTKNENENIQYVGINLMYHGMQTEDEAVLELFSNLFDIKQNEIPVRELVPLEITYDHNAITIQSEQENVNTTLAALDTFCSNDSFEKKNHLLYVGKGTTKIKVEYPMFKKGCLVSLIGILGFLFYLWQIKKKK